MKRLSLLVLSLVAIAAVAIPALAATRRKPVAYGYAQCKSKTNCSYTGNTNPSGKSLTLFANKVCVSARNVMSQVGAMKVSSGKFSKSARGSASDPKTQTFVPVKVRFRGTLRARKSVTGTLTVTTTASDCAKIAGKAQHFYLKYTGPIYGG